MNDASDPISSAIDRLGENSRLLNGAVSGLELMLLQAEKLDQEDVGKAVPFLSLIWLYGSAIRDLLDAKREDGTKLWNAPALASLCRPLQEAFLSLFYFVVEKPAASEAEFRQLLLFRHAAYKRWDLLRHSDQSNPAIACECASALVEWEEAQQILCRHQHMKLLAPEVARKLVKNRDQYIPDSLEKIWDRAGLPQDLYRVTFRYLSQYAHATPYAMASLNSHSAGYESGVVRLLIPIGLALACIAQAIQFASKLHPSLDALLPPAFREFMDVSEISAQMPHEEGF
jgi:hypothetical protein